MQAKQKAAAPSPGDGGISLVERSTESTKRGDRRRSGQQLQRGRLSDLLSCWAACKGMADNCLSRQSLTLSPAASQLSRSFRLFGLAGVAVGAHSFPVAALPFPHPSASCFYPIRRSKRRRVPGGRLPGCPKFSSRCRAWIRDLQVLSHDPLSVFEGPPWFAGTGGFLDMPDRV